MKRFKKVETNYTAEELRDSSGSPAWSKAKCRLQRIARTNAA
ncbi:MAG: hypothetical protein ABIT96_01705 [Ferruginibacter sp.]